MNYIDEFLEQFENEKKQKQDEKTEIVLRKMAIAPIQGDDYTPVRNIYK